MKSQILILVCLCSQVYPKLTTQKGGVLFEDIGGAQVNADFLYYKRVAETSTLQLGVTSAADFLSKYYQLCSTITTSRNSAQEHKEINRNVTIETIVTPVKFLIRDSQRVCKNLQAREPEVRNFEDYTRILKTAQQHSVTIIKAGIFFDGPTNSFRYQSDHQPVEKDTPFTKLYYGGDYPEKDYDTQDWLNDHYIHKMAPRYFLAYQDPVTNFRLRMADKNVMNHYDYVICDKLIQPDHDLDSGLKNNILYKMTAHNCDRELQSIVQTLAFVISEARVITNLNVSSSDLPDNRDLFPKISKFNFTKESDQSVQKNQIGNRVKRNPAAIAGGAMLILGAANVISSAVNGGAPLSWVGKIMGPLLGLATESSNQEYQQALLKMAHEITNLKIADNNQIKAFNNLLTQVSQFEDQQLAQTEALTMLMMESDMRQTTRYLGNVLQIMITKYAQILLAASTGHTSPYALSVTEVDKLSKILHLTTGQTLSTDLSTIKTTATIDNDRLMLVFQIPVISELKQYNFYKPTAMPIFKDGIAYEPHLDADYIAISKTGSKYLILTEDEFQNCHSDPQHCQVHSPARPMSDQSSCTIQTYVQAQGRCPIKMIEKTIVPPFLHIEDNFVFYSVNGSINIYIKCHQHRLTNTYEDATLELKDQGEVHIKSSCSATLPDGSTFDIKAATSVQALSELPIFQIVKFFPQPSNFTYEASQKIIQQQPLPPLEEDSSAPSLETVIRQAMHPKHGLTFALHLGIVLISLIVLAVTAYIFRNKIRALTRICRGKKTQEEDPENLSAVESEEKLLRAQIAKLAEDFSRFKTIFFRSKPIEVPQSDSNLENAARAQQPVWFIPEEEPQPKQPPIHFPANCPPILRQHLEQVDKAYQQHKSKNPPF